MVKRIPSFLFSNMIEVDGFWEFNQIEMESFLNYVIIIPIIVALINEASVPAIKAFTPN